VELAAVPQGRLTAKGQPAVIRTLLRGLAAVAATCTCSLAAYAQAPAPAAPAPERSAPVAEYVLALIAAAAVLLVVCMPSRK
jgi:hypothetical protein